jgi:ribosomal-protein-alanine N-acetyltransferase
MREVDLPEVLAIENSSFPNPWQEATFQGEILNQSISFPLVIVHSLQRKVIGYIIFWKVFEDVQINNIAVHPEFRRLGIGRVVLEYVIDQVRRDGAKFITLEVRPSNTAALTLYKKLGFKPISIRKGYYSNPNEDAFVLGLRLN